MVKYSALACVFVLAIASATAQEAPPVHVGADAATVVPAELRGGSHSGVTEAGWSWYRGQRTWNWWTGSAWGLWMDFTNSGDTIWLINSAGDGADDQMNLAAASGNWLGIYWTSSSSWSASQLWYY